MLIAGRSCHIEWNSTMMSTRSPTALRIFSNGSSAALRSAAEMCRPRVFSAAWSNGQIFMAVMPSASNQIVVRQPHPTRRERREQLGRHAIRRPGHEGARLVVQLVDRAGIGAREADSGLSGPKTKAR